MNLLLLNGEEVKALGDGKVGGDLVRFSGPDSPDISMFKDYFTKSTDFDIEFPATSSVYFHHGRSPRFGKQRLTRGTMNLKADGTGIEIEAQLNMSDPKQAELYEEVKAGKHGWSSGSAPHLVERQKVGKAHHITKWPLGLDATISPTPCDPNNVVRALKALDDSDEEEGVLPLSAFEIKATEVLDQVDLLLEEAAATKAARADKDKPLSWAMRSRIMDIQNQVERLLAAVSPVPGGNQVLHGLADLKIMEILNQQRSMSEY